MSRAKRRVARHGSLRTRGFTLIEVLVALAIVAIGMAALLAALGSSADSITYQRDKSFAEWVALNRIAEARVATKRPTKGAKNSGEVEMAGVKWRWQEEVLETEVKGILRIDVSVRPASIPGDKDEGWYTTVTGIVGDALAPPRGDMDPFGAPMQQGGPGGEGNPQGQGGQGQGQNQGQNSGQNSGQGSGNNNPNPSNPPNTPQTPPVTD
jgi:general secretion pathway protein I